MKSNYLSNVELYYCLPENVKQNNVVISGEEFHHIVNVMRHQSGDEVYVTNGKGDIFFCKINDIQKENLTATITNKTHYEMKFPGITFCIPRLKNPERFEFALEKCVELGITSFIVFNAKNSVARGEKIERWKKILLSAMKQSLLSYHPEITFCKSFTEIVNLDGEKVILEQTAQKTINELKPEKSKRYYFIFGPEGGFDESEINLIDPENHFNLVGNRLRSETAIIHTASLLQMLF